LLRFTDLNNVKEINSAQIEPKILSSVRRKATVGGRLSLGDCLRYQSHYRNRRPRLFFQALQVNFRGIARAAGNVVTKATKIRRSPIRAARRLQQRLRICF